MMVIVDNGIRDTMVCVLAGALEAMNTRSMRNLQRGSARPLLGIMAMVLRWSPDLLVGGLPG